MNVYGGIGINVRNSDKMHIKNCTCISSILKREITREEVTFSNVYTHKSKATKISLH